MAPGRVTAVDLAPDVVAQAQADPARPSNLEFRVADVTALPFGDAEFDVVHMHQVLHHLSEPLAAIRELARVARPGGIVALREADYGAAFWFPPAPAWQAWRECFQLVGRASGGELDAGRRLRAWLDAAGLTAFAQFSGSLWTYPGLAPASEIAASWADRLTEAHFAGLAAAAGVADESSLAATAKGLIEWGRSPAPFFAIPHVEALIQLPG